MTLNIFAIVISATAFSVALVYLPKYIRQHHWGSVISLSLWCIVNAANIVFVSDKIIAAETHFSISWRIVYACSLAVALVLFAILRTIQNLRKMNNSINEAIADLGRLKEGEEIVITFVSS